MSLFGTRRQSEPEPPAPTTKLEPSYSPQPQPIGFETVLGANSVMEGALTSSANVRLDGAFTGTLQITGNVLVGETAKINADIDAKNISIAGAVRGNVTGKKVQLLRTGRVWGDISATALTTEEGAFIDGKISMQSHEAAQPIAEPEVMENILEVEIVDEDDDGDEIPDVMESPFPDDELDDLESAEDEDESD